MKVAPIVWALAAVLAGAYGIDFLQRVTSQDIVAVSFSEGGDDAYYFFTVARNIAQGHGITIDGTHWTTGFQPLWVLVCAVAFLAPSDRAALAIVYLISIALWLLSALLFGHLVRRLSLTPVQSSAAALLAVLFLGEGQFTRGYFNGRRRASISPACFGSSLPSMTTLASTRTSSACAVSWVWACSRD